MFGRIDRYIFREIVPPFGLTLAALMLVLLTDQLIRLIELLVNRGADLSTLFKILIWLLPPFLVIAIPAGVLIGVIIAFNRLSSDNEIIALQANGFSFTRLMVPALVFAGIAFSVTFALSVSTHPWTGRSNKDLALSLLKSQTTLAIEPGVFNEPFKDMVFYVEETPSPMQLKGILIYDLRDPDSPVLTLAQEGAITSHPAGKSLGFNLVKGNQYRFSTQDPDRHQQIQFAQYEFNMDIDALLRQKNRTMKSLSPDQLREAMKQNPAKAARYRRFLEEHYKNYAFPFSCLIFGLIGVPAGITFRKTGRLGGFAVGLFLGTAYFFLLFLGDYLATAGTLPPMLSAWIPNIIMFTCAIGLIIRSKRGWV